jgi:hypothetical protein
MIQSFPLDVLVASSLGLYVKIARRAVHEEANNEHSNDRLHLLFYWGGIGPE